MDYQREAGGGHVRASDRDRNRVAEQLRIHCAEGRLEVEELERRLELAMSASTVEELAGLVHDVPRVPVPHPAAEPPAKVRVGFPGIRPFARRIEVPARIDRVRRNVLDTLAVGLNSAGYEMVYQDPETLRFQRAGKERVTIDLEEHGRSRTTMIVYGRASWRTRKHFAKLHFPG